MHPYGWLPKFNHKYYFAYYAHSLLYFYSLNTKLIKVMIKILFDGVAVLCLLYTQLTALIK